MQGAEDHELFEESDSAAGSSNRCASKWMNVFLCGYCETPLGSWPLAGLWLLVALVRRDDVEDPPSSAKISVTLANARCSGKVKTFADPWDDALAAIA